MRKEKVVVSLDHAGMGREVKFNGAKGFDGENIYEFQAYNYHRYPKCYLFNEEEPWKVDPSDNYIVGTKEQNKNPKTLEDTLWNF